jgi:hypothetical protein
VPAELSSAVPTVLTHLAHAEALQPAETPHLLAYLATIRDPRAGRGRRHPLVAILAMAAAAVLTGARSMAAIAEWAQDAHSRSAPRWAPAATPPPTSRYHPRPPSAGAWPAWTLTPWPG